VTPKLIYYAERHPRLDAEGFSRRWREHGRLGMSLPRWRNVLRYAQYDPIDALRPSWSAPCDGVATVVFRSEENRVAHAADPDAGVTRADERETFARPVKAFSVLTTEAVVLPHRRATCRLFLRLFRNPDVETAAWAEWLATERAARHSARMAALDPEAGYSQNIARPDSAGIGLGLHADCVEEISSDLVSELAAALEGEAADREFRRHVQRYDMVATREVLLHGD